jgi:hypothetical protein
MTRTRLLTLEIKPSQKATNTRQVYRLAMWSSIVDLVNTEFAALINVISLAWWWDLIIIITTMAMWKV